MLSPVAGQAPPGATWSGQWTVYLETPGGGLPVGLHLDGEAEQLTASFRNGPEEIPVKAWVDASGKLFLDMEHYDSRMTLTPSGPGEASGVWTKTRGVDHLATVPCTARRKGLAESESAASFIGRWEVLFDDSDDPAVGEFSLDESGHVLGTFLTTTGDYRYLYGGVQAGVLQLSCFDGGHAFLFRAKLDGQRLAGDFWSGNWYHTQWTATKNESASVPDGFSQVALAPGASLRSLAYLGLDGKRHQLSEAEFVGRVTVVEVFGTWCPNCHDAAELLGELNDKYRDRGLVTVGLAFELTGDESRDIRQLERYIKRFKIEYPVLLAGGSDKAAASLAFPVIDQVRSYPTTLFIDAGGAIRAVYSGFSGPATGEAHQKLRAQFEALIEKLLSE